MSKLIGQNLGRYRIDEVMGEGGMATVYKAFDTHLECDVALKIIRMDRLSPNTAENTVKRFQREARVLSQLTHPNIVKITDYGEFEGEPYLVMVYLSGGSLKQHMTGQPMPWAQAAQLLVPIARALEYAHGKGMVHRDVKPANILLTQSGEPMLSDFGVAKLFDTEQTMKLTATGMGLGTPEYMAPEQATSGAIDARADIYALGVVFYELVTGRKPYAADTPVAVLLKQAAEDMPRPSSLVKGLPPQVENMILKAMAKNPADRFENMGLFANALVSLTGISAPNTGGAQAMHARTPAPSSQMESAFPTLPGSFPENKPNDGSVTAAITNEMSLGQEGGGKKRKLKWLWWTLGSIGGVILLCVLGYFGLSKWGGSLVTPTAVPVTVTMEEPTATIQPIQPTLQATETPTEIPPSPTPFPLNIGLAPIFGEVELPQGFSPTFRDVTSGGEINAAYLLTNCKGYVSGAPTLRIIYTASRKQQISFYFVANTSGQNTTLIVHTPDDMWFCNDDAFLQESIFNPFIGFTTAPDGRYDIWVGSFHKGDSIDGRLRVGEYSELP